MFCPRLFSNGFGNSQGIQSTGCRALAVGCCRGLVVGLLSIILSRQQFLVEHTGFALCSFDAGQLNSARFCGGVVGDGFGMLRLSCRQTALSISVILMPPLNCLESCELLIGVVIVLLRLLFSLFCLQPRRF